MSNILIAIDAAIALTQLASNVAQASIEIQTTLQKAQSEGRDLTDEEVAAIQAKRKAAVDRWESLGPQ